MNDKTMKLYNTETREDASAGVSGEKGASGKNYKSDGIDRITDVIETKKDNINPNHYRFGDIEAMDFVDAVLKYGGFKVNQAHYVFNIIKYLVRAPRKNGLEDLRKAKWNLDRLIEKMEVENDTKI